MNNQNEPLTTKERIERLEEQVDKINEQLDKLIETVMELELIRKMEDMKRNGHPYLGIF